MRKQIQSYGFAQRMDASLIHDKQEVVARRRKVVRDWDRYIESSI